jgi:hypothetical protein
MKTCENCHFCTQVGLPEIGFTLSCKKDKWRVMNAETCKDYVDAKDVFPDGLEKIGAKEPQTTQLNLFL